MQKKIALPFFAPYRLICSVVSSGRSSAPAAGRVRPAAGLELKDPHRYRVRTLPAAGALLRQEDTTEQMSL